MAKKTKKPANPNHRLISNNRRAKHDYEILETFEAGIELVGSEVKSLRGGNVTFGDSHIGFDKEQAYIYDLFIPEYVFSNQFNHAPTRVRRLLMKKGEILRLMGKVKVGGLALIPLQLYFNKSWVKLEFALARGKKQHDKRESLKAADAKREMARAKATDY
ncbi:MAG: SsrA-binding protein [Bradymonadia bacterium]|jgi:SsrA-binding protein